jgi:SAM-dependent methyltransferase
MPRIETVSSFDIAYEGSPTWDIGRPQPAIVRLEEAGRIAGSVLDAGCGTGENALYLAARGHEVVGVDLARRAIERASAKAVERGIDATFRVGNALRLGELGRRFDTAIDVGLFHTLADEERIVYARSLHEAVAPGGRCFVLCWSERNPWGVGPRRVTHMELLGSFEEGWTVDVIEEERLEGKLAEGSVHAWLASFTRA